MRSHHAHALHPLHSRYQRGVALLLMLVILIVGATAMLLRSLSNTALRNERDKATAEALSQAKSALIGYAITYGDTHTGNVHGYLPCPDTDGTPEGSAQTPCGSKNANSIGRLPWKTLGLPVLRDNSGECLWYAVSGTYKNSPPTDLMNWDNQGQLNISDATGSTISTNIVAVIFAPGTVINNQDRTPSPNAPICGGNYTPVAYLDNDIAHSVNNSDVATGNFIQPHEHRDSNGNVTFITNDQLIFITSNDIFNTVKKRNDFGAFVSTLLSTATSCLSTLASPVTMAFNSSSPFTTETPVGTSVGNLTIGRVPKTCLNANFDNWQDNLMYAKCTSGLACLTVNGAGCRGVVIFSGERNSSQTRSTNIQKNTWNNYIEDAPYANLTAFTTGATTFAGATNYSSASPSTDVLACIP